MVEIVPIPFYPNKPTGTLLAAVKKAKQQIDTTTLIAPARAVPGSPMKIIAIEETPHWVCDHVIVPKGDHVKLKTAIEWALGLNENPEGVTVLTRLQETFGPDVKEITNV